MTYKILSIKLNDDTIFTEVEYDIDGDKFQVTVPHFRPQTADDVAKGIVNRLMSEKIKKESASNCSQVVSQIEIGKVVEVVE